MVVLYRAVKEAISVFYEFKGIFGGITEQQEKCYIALNLIEQAIILSDSLRTDDYGAYHRKFIELSGATEFADRDVIMYARIFSEKYGIEITNV